MNLESLPNEILLDLFDYLNGINLLCTFSGLNFRFNFLLYQQFQFYCVNFKCIVKRTFDLICEQHLPFIADRIVTLTLSNYKHTPELINQFLLYMPPSCQFTRLRSIKIFELRSYEILLKFLCLCQHCCSLTHFQICTCVISSSEANYQLIVDNIFSIPKLTNCYIDISIEEQKLSSTPRITSSSLKCLTICNVDYTMIEINRLFESTPHLEDLVIGVALINHVNIACPFLTLNTLKICFTYHSDYSKLAEFFQKTPNLRHLDVRIWSKIIDGHQWEQIIRSYLPKLEIFHLIMQEILFHAVNVEEEINRLINTFQSSFWINEHQWFIRCFTMLRVFHLYTLNNVPEYLSSRFPDLWRSTYPNDNPKGFYKKLTYIYEETPFHQLISSDICLSNIQTLQIKFPIPDHFYSIVPNLNKLEFLTILQYADTFQDQLQNLLDRTSRLCVLEFKQDASLSLQTSLFQCTNASLYQIDLCNYNHCFNQEECLMLSHSPLAVQCHALSIQINNRQNILYLIKNLIKLRALHIHWIEQNNDKSRNNIKETIDQLVQWLKHHLPSTYSIVNDQHYGHNHISIWL